MPSGNEILGIVTITTLVWFAIWWVLWHHTQIFRRDIKKTYGAKSGGRPPIKDRATFLYEEKHPFRFRE
jgi:hypothetical protein